MPSNDLEDIWETEEYEGVGLEQDDFGFIIGADGKLKKILCPEQLVDNPPEEVKKILAIFGVDEVDELINGRTLH
jgi:hypothetical protein